MTHGLMALTPVLSLVIFCCVASACEQNDGIRTQSNTSTGEFQPDFENSSLTIDKETFKPDIVREKWPNEFVVGGTLIQVKDGAFQAIDYRSGVMRWQEIITDGVDIEWLNSHKEVAYYFEMNKEFGSRSKATGDAVVKRIRLEDGTTLSPLKIPAESLEIGQANYAVSLLANDDGITVLSMCYKEEDSDTKCVGYRLTRFVKESSEVSWTKFYKSAGTVPIPSAFLLGSFGPTFDNTAITRLAWLDGQILVCAGPLEDLMLLNHKTGEIVWKVPRVWEYKRGFIGPSVWSHFIGRYGIKDAVIETASLTLEEIRERNEKEESFYEEESFQKLKEYVESAKAQAERRIGSVIAGPVIVPCKGRVPTHHIFIATSQSEDDSWSNYLADCIVYELDQEGKVIGMVTLPRLVVGANRTVVDDILVWFGEQYSLAKLYTSERGTRDSIIDVNWQTIRDLPDFENLAGWYNNGAWTREVAFDKQYSYSVFSGGEIVTEKEKEYRFVLIRRDLTTNQTIKLNLIIPFQGDVSKPETNYSLRTGNDGVDRWVSYSSMPLSLAGIKTRGDHLCIVIEELKPTSSQTRNTSLEFDLKVLSGLKVDTRE